MTDASDSWEEDRGTSDEEEEEDFVLKLVAPLCGVLAFIVILILLYCFIQRYWNEKTQPAELPEGGLDNCGQPADEDDTGEPDYETLTTLTTIPPALPPRNPDSLSSVGIRKYPSSSPSSITGYSSQNYDADSAAVSDVSLNLVRRDPSGHDHKVRDNFRGSGLLEGVDSYHRHIPGGHAIGAPAHEQMPDRNAPLPPSGLSHHRDESLEDDYMVPVRANLNDYVTDPMAAIQAKKGITEYMQKV